MSRPAPAADDRDRSAGVPGRRHVLPASAARSGAILLASLLLATALTGCETTQEKSAQLERAAHRRDHDVTREKVVSVSDASRDVKVLWSAVVTGKEGAVVVVHLRDLSSQPIAEAPIEIEVRSAAGGTLYTNATPGLAASLITAPLLEPHRAATWVDDQVQLSGKAAGVKVLVGEGKRPGIVLAPMRIEHVSQIEGGQGVTGTVANDSAVQQRELVVYGVAERNGMVLAAGRAIVPTLDGHSSAAFDIYLIGAPKGAKVQLSAPATTW